MISGLLHQQLVLGPRRAPYKTLNAPLHSDELPQTVTVKDDTSSPPGPTSVKTEPPEFEEKQSEGSSSLLMPPLSITVKAEVKKAEEEDGKAEEDDTPCTKMTMRLRRNISNPQCVSRPTS